jgi:DNA-binding MarR family transcriptional regulator
VAQDAEDRRSRILILTAKGRDLLAHAVPIWERTHAEVERQLGDTKPENLRAGLMAVL